MVPPSGTIGPGGEGRIPGKIRQLRADLKAAGFAERSDRGKGSHAVWVYVARPRFKVTLSGRDGDDARPYQEKGVKDAIAKATGIGDRVE